MIIVFELVEITAVDSGWDQPIAWLGVPYLVAGVQEIALGYALARDTDAALGQEGTAP